MSYSYWFFGPLLLITKVLVHSELCLNYFHFLHSLNFFFSFYSCSQFLPNTSGLLVSVRYFLVPQLVELGHHQIPLVFLFPNLYFSFSFLTTLSSYSLKFISFWSLVSLLLSLRLRILDLLYYS